MVRETQQEQGRALTLAGLRSPRQSLGQREHGGDRDGVPYADLDTRSRPDLFPVQCVSESQNFGLELLQSSPMKARMGSRNQARSSLHVGSGGVSRDTCLSTAETGTWVLLTCDGGL